MQSRERGQAYFGTEVFVALFASMYHYGLLTQVTDLALPMGFRGVQSDALFPTCVHCVLTGCWVISAGIVIPCMALTRIVRANSVLGVLMALC